MDSVTAQFYLWTTEITDAKRVEAAPLCQEVARDILEDACRRLRQDSGHPVVQLLGELASGKIPIKELQKQELIKDILRKNDYKHFLNNNREKLGDDYYQYLETCFERTIREYVRPRRSVDPQRRRAKWLAIGFYLAWAKKDADNQSKMQERNADVTQSQQFIIDAYNNRSLLNGVGRFAAGDSDVLPKSIERLIKLKGYVGGGPRIGDSRKTVSKACLKIFQTIEKNADHRSRKVASRVYAECVKACRAHLLRILRALQTDNREGCNDAEIGRVQERINNLVSFGAPDRRKGNKGIGPAGLEKVYSKNQHKLPAPDRRRNKPKTPEQLEAEYSLLLDTPVIGDAVRLIDSPDVNNDIGAKLVKLEKRTPFGTEHLWRMLWKRYTAALQRAADRQNADK